MYVVYPDIKRYQPLHSLLLSATVEGIFLLVISLLHRSFSFDSQFNIRVFVLDPEFSSSGPVSMQKLELVRELI